MPGGKELAEIKIPQQKIDEKRKLIYNEIVKEVGEEITVEKAYDASSLICELTLATILNNNIELSSIAPINVIGYVNAIDTFENHADVLNGFLKSKT